MNVSCRIDTKAFDKAMSEFEQKCKDALRDVGERAVQYAVEHGEYHDRTGRLRRSNKYEITKNGLRIYNTAPYAEEVQNRGLDVINGAAMYAQSELEKIARR